MNFTPRPDFGRFRDTLLLRQAYRRPPLFDFHVDPAHKARVLGRPVATPVDEVEFWWRAGYDYVQCTVHVPATELSTMHAQEKSTAATYSSHAGIITDLAQFRSRSWSWQPAAAGDLTGIQQQLDGLARLVKVLPSEMKIVLHNADVFTLAWELVGFTNFCLWSHEQPELLRELMNSLAAAELNAMRAAAAVAGNALGAVFYSDDIAYTEGLMLSPAFFAEFLFPTIAEVGRIGAERGAPLIYHTDGRLYDVFDHLAAINVRGIQPLEPKSMDPLEIKRRWPGKFCLMGNIDLDLLSRGTPAEVETQVRQRIDRLNVGGGYMPGVSNTVPYYVKFENYQRMIETVYSYPDGLQ